MSQVKIPLNQIISREALTPILAFVSQCNYAGVNVWLVGGSVRDGILGNPSKDLDLVVDVDVLKLMSKIQMPFQHFERFSTAKTQIANFPVDIASARTEIYTKPGALPKVLLSDIQSDLARRDFSMNSIAISLNKGSQGVVLDPYNGLQDIYTKTIRILHSDSFKDDATRILRAIKYSVRLGFDLAPQTKKILKNNINFLNSISSSRLRRELISITDEPLGASILLYAHNVGVFSEIFRNLNNSEFKNFLLSAKKSSLSGIPLFMYLLSQLNLTDSPPRISISKKEKSLTEKLQNALTSKDLNKHGLAPSGIKRELKHFSENEIQILLKISNQKMAFNIKLFLSKAHLRPLLTFNDLLIMGLPENKSLRVAMDLLSDAVIDGKVKGRQSQVTYVQRLMLEGLDNESNIH
ncbi:MAG: hypothetical protein CL889_03785 [Dehalococcoidia bacterium]|nr:hypothetical protein [Dehalococcoidia bacterium]